MNKHKHYDVIVAWAEGKTVQFKSPADNEWIDVVPSSDASSPAFRSHVEYRIKPETEYRHRAFYPVVFVGQEYVAQYNGHRRYFMFVNRHGGVHRLNASQLQFIGEELTEDHWRR